MRGTESNYSDHSRVNSVGLRCPAEIQPMNQRSSSIQLRSPQIIMENGD